MSVTLDLGTKPLGWPESYGEEAQPRMGFFTDTSICIGCKACEVACKEWNEVPEDNLVFSGESFDNTGALSANSWRHVAFIEQSRTVDLPMPSHRRPGADRQDDGLPPDGITAGQADSSPVWS